MSWQQRRTLSGIAFSPMMDTILERNGIVWSLEDEKLITINDLAIQLNMAKKLVCFIYDPDGFIVNPEGLKHDLEQKHEGFVIVHIEPRE